MRRLQWYGLQHIDVVSLADLHSCNRFMACSPFNSGHRHSWQHNTCGRTVRFPNRSNSFGIMTHSVLTSPRPSIDLRRLSNWGSRNLFNIECATLFVTSDEFSSSRELSFFSTRSFHRRFTKLLRLERNIKHEHSCWWWGFSLTQVQRYSTINRVSSILTSYPKPKQNGHSLRKEMSIKSHLSKYSNKNDNDTLSNTNIYYLWFSNFSLDASTLSC